MTLIQEAMFPPPVDWTLTPVKDLPVWPTHGRVAIDCETRDPQLKKLGPGVRRDGQIVGYSFAIEDGPSFYVPVRHALGENSDPKQVFQYLRDMAARFKGILVGANLPYDLDYLAEEGVEFQPKFFRDIQVAEPLIDELQMFYSLEAIAKRHKFGGKDETTLRWAANAHGVDPKSEMWKMPAKFVAKYAIRDTVLPLQILRRQEALIEKEGLWDIFNLESRVLPILVKMRRRGVRVDFDRLDQVEKMCLEKETAAVGEVYTRSGVRVGVDDVWKSEVLAEALRETGIEVPTTPKTGKPSIKKDWLAEVDHPIARALAEARRFSKVRQTFVKSIRDHATNGRIHATINQLRAQREDGGIYGAAYGRCSSTNPNLQQQPGDEWWRRIFLPEDGCEWACCDFSSQEPRLIVHYGAMIEAEGGPEAAAAWRENPHMDYHQRTADLCSIARKQGKIIFLGRSYGMGGAKFCNSLGLPTKIVSTKYGHREVAGDEGQALLDRFDGGVPYVAILARSCQNRAARKGFIQTLLGRRCRFPLDDLGRYDFCHKALNRLIQGGSADQMKKAMVDADAAGYELQLQVHDELDFSCKTREEAHGLADIMVDAVQLRVPTVVDVEIGPSWGEIVKDETYVR